MIDDGDRKLIAQAEPQRFFYVIDRTDGKLLSATITQSFLEHYKRRDRASRPRQSASPTPEGIKSAELWSHELDVTDLQSADQTFFM